MFTFAAYGDPATAGQFPVMAYTPYAGWPAAAGVYPSVLHQQMAAVAASVSNQQTSSPPTSQVCGCVNGFIELKRRFCLRYWMQAAKHAIKQHLLINPVAYVRNALQCEFSVVRNNLAKFVIT